MDTISGSMRLTFDLPDLIRGVSFLVVVIGLFGIGELLETMQSPLSAKPVADTDRTGGGVPRRPRLARLSHRLAAQRADRLLDGIARVGRRRPRS